MINIRNANVVLYDFNKSIAFINFNAKDQDLDTLKAIGKGKQCNTSKNLLEYKLKDVSLYTRTDLL